MGNCWLIQPWAVGLGIWHHPSHGADPPCPGHQRLACLDPHCTEVCHGNSWGLGGDAAPALPDGQRWMGCRRCARGPLLFSLGSAEEPRSIPSRNASLVGLSAGMWRTSQN